MSTFQIAYNATTKTATVQADGDVLPDGSIDIGSFDHDEETDPLGEDVNHVFFHHVRDALYKRSVANPANVGFWPDNITDMASITIVIDTVLAVTGVTMTPATVEVEEGATTQLTVVIAPEEATDQGVTYVSSDPTKATVSATGLVTGVAAGETTITVTTDDGSFTDTTVVTVVAP